MYKYHLTLPPFDAAPIQRRYTSRRANKSEPLKIVPAVPNSIEPKLRHPQPGLRMLLSLGHFPFLLACAIVGMGRPSVAGQSHIISLVFHPTVLTAPGSHRYRILSNMTLQPTLRQLLSEMKVIHCHGHTNFSFTVVIHRWIAMHKLKMVSLCVLCTQLAGS